MDLSYSDEQQALREAVRGAVDREASLAQVRAWVLGDGEPDHDAAFDLAVRQGWTGIGIPEEDGGQGGGLLELAVLAEELGRGAVPADRLYATLLAGLALRGSGAPELEAICEGETRAALLHSGATPLDDADPGLSLVLGAPGAELFVRPGDDGATQALASGEFVVLERSMVDRTRTVGDVTGPVGGAPASTELAAWAAVIVAADLLGACQRMLDLTTQYVQERVQFGKPVGSFQAVKHMAAEMLVSIEGTRAAVQYAAWAAGAGEAAASSDAWVAKSRAARTATKVADGALFLHGAVGYTWEHDLQLLFKRAKSDAELFGGAMAHEDRIADDLGLT